MEKKQATVKKDWFRQLSMKRIENMSDNMLERYLKRGETLLNANIRQFKKPQKQFGNKSAAEMGWQGHVEDMEWVMSQPANTLQEKQEKLRLISNKMKLEYYSPTQAREKMREYTQSKEYETWNGVMKMSYYGENADELTYNERKVIWENTRGVFSKFTRDEIETIGSGNILSAAIKYRELGLTDYHEMTRRAVISVKRAYAWHVKKEREAAESKPPKTPFAIINK